MNNNRKTKKLYSLDEVVRYLHPDPVERRAHLRAVRIEMKKIEAEYQRELSRKLQKAREKAAISQSELAYRLGTQKTAISRIESGRQNITMGTLVRACHAMGATCKVDIKLPKR